MTDPLKIIRPVVQVRRRWADPWTTMEYLIPLTCQCAISPTIPTASFKWRFGSIGQEGHAFDSFLENDPSLVDWYIRIGKLSAKALVQDPDKPELTTVWVGVVTVDETDPGKSDCVPIGEQTLTARGLEWRLQQAAVDGSWVRGPDPLIEDAYNAVQVDTVIPFNMKSRAGNSLRGNRSGLKYPRDEKAEGGPSSYIFSEDAHVWTARDIAEYLLVWFGPKNPPIGMFDAEGNLSLVERVYPGPANVGVGLNMLMDRRRGHAWGIVEHDDALTVWCYPIFDGEISAGTVKLTGNSMPITIDMDADKVGPVKTRRNLDQRYDKIVVRGGPVIVCGTVSFGDGTLEKAWTAARETAYKALSDEDRRNDDRYKNVYTAYRVPADWEAQMGGDMGAGHLTAATPTVLPDGNLDFTAVPATRLWTMGRQFLRQLPLRNGYDYSVDPPVVLDASAPDDFYMTRVYFEYATGKFAPADRLDQAMEGAPAMRISLLDGELGIRVACSVNHWLADNHWGGAAASAWSPVFDYEDVVGTVALATDQRLAVTVSVGGVASDFPRTKRIDVDGAEAWVLLPYTVIGVSGGALERSPGTVVTLRNDRDVLASVAAAARAWYCKERVAVAVTYLVPEYDICPGQFLTALEGTMGVITVNTMVSRVVYDFDKGSTTVETDHGELDFVSMLGLGSSGSGALPVPALSAPAVRDKRVGLPAGEAALGMWASKIERGKVVGDFESGTTMTVDPCDDAGTDNGRPNVTLNICAAPARPVTEPWPEDTVVTFIRYAAQTDAGSDGILIGIHQGTRGSPKNLRRYTSDLSADSATWLKGDQGENDGCDINLHRLGIENHGDNTLTMQIFGRILSIDSAGHPELALHENLETEFTVELTGGNT